MSEDAAVDLELGSHRLRLAWNFRARYRLQKLPVASFLAKAWQDSDPLEVTAELIWAMIPAPPHERRTLRLPEDVAWELGRLTPEQRATVEKLVDTAVQLGTPKVEAPTTPDQEVRPPGE